MNDTTYRYCPSCRAELTTVERGGKPRLACPDCGFVQWRNPVPVVAAVVEREGHVILVHSIGRPPTWFGLVAGFLEQGEHPEAAVLREVDEELGIPAKLESCIGIYPFELFNQIIFAYHVRGGPGQITARRLGARHVQGSAVREAEALAAGHGPCPARLARRARLPPAVRRLRHPHRRLNPGFGAWDAQEPRCARRLVSRCVRPPRGTVSAQGMCADEPLRMRFPACPARGLHAPRDQTAPR